MMPPFIEFVTQLHYTILGMEFGPIPIVVATVVLTGVLLFFIRYVAPAFLLGRRLRKLTKRLRKLQQDYADDRLVPREKVEEIFKGHRLFKHLWSEFQETLHNQYDYKDGEQHLVQIRATLPAETFFNSQVVVDSPINSEFFKHLPGILTGIGIIGTFVGLISGLHSFEASTDHEKLDASLKALIFSVQEAFIASGFAIFCAMVITFIEKWSINRLYGDHEHMTQALDALYDAGAGEEYLSQLVQYTEENATQTRHLKDSLVEDLKQLLTDLTEKQIAATHQASQHMANEVGSSISQSLESPLSKIAEVVHQASNDQGVAVHGMLQDLLSAFMAKLDDTLGGQMKGLNTMMVDSANAMRETQAGLASLVSQLSEAGETTSRSMSENLTRMMQEAELRQQEMVEKLNQTVEELSSKLSGVQGEMHTQLADGVSGLKEAMQAAMGELAEQRQSMAQSNADDMQKMQAAMATLLGQVSQSGQDVAQQYGERLDTSLNQVQTQLGEFFNKANESQQNSQSRTDNLLTTLEERIKELLGSTREGAEAMKANVQSLKEVTTRAIDGMNQGADRMKSAADEFSAAGQSVTGVMEQGDRLYEKMTTAASTLESSTAIVRSVVASYDQSRQGMEEMVRVFREVTELMERRAGSGQDIVENMEAVVNKFETVQQDMQAYLELVGDVLHTGFTDFSDAVTTNMSRARGEFDKSLSEAVQMISMQLQELEAVLDSVTSRRA